jgi:hypothetical protein
MSGIFDRLQTKIDDKNKQGGITVLDLADLPPALRKIMRLMLRQIRMDYLQLCAAMDNLPEAERLARVDLDRSLETLTAQAWLTRLGEGAKAVYKVNLRVKSGSTLAGGIWVSLDEKLKK